MAPIHPLPGMAILFPSFADQCTPIIPHHNKNSFHGEKSVLTPPKPKLGDGIIKSPLNVAQLTHELTQCFCEWPLTGINRVARRDLYTGQPQRLPRQHLLQLGLVRTGLRRLKRRTKHHERKRAVREYTKLLQHVKCNQASPSNSTPG